jgi:hypothetical protein
MPETGVFLTVCWLADCVITTGASSVVLRNNNSTYGPLPYISDRGFPVACVPD